MSFIQRELERIGSELTTSQSARYAELYAAQQALVWALEPTGFKSPYDMLVQIKDTQEGSKDCPEGSDRFAFLNNPDLRAC
jgi:hypothetical protein